MSKNLPNLQKLIDQTQSYMQEAELNGDKDLRWCYMDDARIFIEVNVACSFGHYNKAKKVIDGMDTEPREQVVMALAKDLGKDIVANELGWEVR